MTRLAQRQRHLTLACHPASEGALSAFARVLHEPFELAGFMEFQCDECRYPCVGHGDDAYHCRLQRVGDRCW